MGRRRVCIPLALGRETSPSRLLLGVDFECLERSGSHSGLAESRWIIIDVGV